jgi:hypothetical protein
MGGGLRTIMNDTKAAGKGGTDGEELSPDDVFHVLQNRRRRYALHFLKQQDETAEIGEVAQQVAAWENAVEPEAVTSTQRKRVYNSLQQSHFPKLNEEGLAEYDERSGSVKLTERADRLDVYMEVVAGRDIPWSEYFLGLGALSVAITAAVWTGIFPFTLLPPVAWLAFVTTTFTVSAGANFYYQRRQRLGSSDSPAEMHANEPDGRQSLFPDWIGGD